MFFFFFFTVICALLLVPFSLISPASGSLVFALIFVCPTTTKLFLAVKKGSLPPREIVGSECPQFYDQSVLSAYFFFFFDFEFVLPSPYFGWFKKLFNFMYSLPRYALV